MKIVIVCFEFARAQRMRSLAEGLTARGHEVVFITSEPDASSDAYTVASVPFTSSGALAKRVVGIDPTANAAEAAARRGRTVERFVRFAARFRDEYLIRPDKQRAWRQAVREWLATSPQELEGVDQVVASMPPVTALYIGVDVAAATGAPLHFDFRDLWTNNPYYPYGPLRRAIDVAAESRLLPLANSATVATFPLERQMEQTYPLLQTKAVYTGIDTAEWTVHPWTRGEVLRFGFIGITYGGKRDLSPFLCSLSRLADTQAIDLDRIKVEMIGEADASAREGVRARGLGDVVTFHGPIPRSEVPEAMSRVDVALLLMWPEDEIAFPLKTSHYLASGKRIVVIGASPTSDVARIMTGMPGVDVCHDDSDIDAAVLRAWTDWTAGKDFIIDASERTVDFDLDTMTRGFLDVMSTRRD